MRRRRHTLAIGAAMVALGLVQAVYVLSRGDRVLAGPGTLYAALGVLYVQYGVRGPGQSGGEDWR